MKMPIVYMMWGASVAGFVAVGVPMIVWKWLSEAIDDALMWE